VRDLERGGIRHIPLHSSTRAASPMRDAQAAGELWRILRRERVDVLHTHNPKPGVYGRIVGRAARVPIIVNTVHGLYATEDDPVTKRAAVYALEAVATRCSDAELFQNPEDLELMQRLHLTRRARFLGNGIDLARFDRARFTADDRRALRRELGAGDDTVVIGSVGRLVGEKGYPELFEAVERLPRDRTVLVVAGGDDPDKADALPIELLERARSSGVRLLGQRDDVDALYAAMDVFALASHREGFPRAAMEAAAMGLPIVATDIRGCRQVVDAGTTGLLVPSRDPAALAAALRTLVDDGSLRTTMGSAGRRRAEEHFDERRVVDMVLGTYRDVATRKRLAIPGLIPA
jgi:glycosyltransferase involved in cell wall biosynthesis